MLFRTLMFMSSVLASVILIFLFSYGSRKEGLLKEGGSRYVLDCYGQEAMTGQKDMVHLLQMPPAKATDKD